MTEETGNRPAESGAGKKPASAVEASDYRALFEHAPSCLWVADASELKARIDELQASGVTDLVGFFAQNPEVLAEAMSLVRVAEANQEVLRIYKAATKEEFATRFLEVITPDALSHFKEALLAVGAGRTTYSGEVVVRALDGEVMWIDLFVALAPGHEGSWSRVLVANTEITARKRLEAELAAQRRILQSLADFDRSINSLDTSRVIRAALSFIEQRLEIPHTSVALLDHERGGFSLLQAAPDSEAGQIERLVPFMDTVLTDVVRDTEPRYRPDLRAERPEYAADAELLQIGLRSDLLIPLIYERECLGTLNCATTEIDGIPEEDRDTLQLMAPRLAQTLANVRLFDAMERSEASLREAQSVAQVGSWEWDIVGDRVAWSDELYHIFGVDRETFDANYEGFLRLVHPDDREALKMSVDGTLNADLPYSVEHRIVRPDGGVRHIRGAARLHRDREGRPTRLVGTAQDVTQQKEAEEQKRGLQEQVLHAQKLESLGILAGGIAHDFNNLLQGILGNADFALSALPPGSMSHSYMQNVIAATRQAAELSQQLLAYSGKGRFLIEPLDLSAVVGEMTQLLRASVSKKAMLRFHLADDLPAVEADRAQIRQIALNLTTNASAALGGKEGAITISTGFMFCEADYLSETYLGPEAQAGTYTYLEVKDTGIGMDEETVARVFDPFFSAKFASRGLGLAAVLGIVRGHGGTIDVESKPGLGTTFRVLLPSSEKPPARREAAQPGSDEWRGAGMVLVVDDEKSVRDLARKMLEHLGFDVVTAQDGREAVEIFQQSPNEIELVLLDLMMPRMSGHEAFEEIRRIRADARVILSSGYSEEETIGKYPATELAGFIMKPYTLTALQQIVRQALEG